MSTFQDATRCPLPAARKGPTVCVFAGSGQRVAGSVLGNVDIISEQFLGGIGKRGSEEVS